MLQILYDYMLSFFKTCARHTVITLAGHYAVLPPPSSYGMGSPRSLGEPLLPHVARSYRLHYAKSRQQVCGNMLAAVDTLRIFRFYQPSFHLHHPR